MIRRHFLQSILALGVAPAIVRADSLMRIVPRETWIVGIDGAGIGLPAVTSIEAAREISLSSIVADIFQWSGMSPAEYDLSALNQPISSFVDDGNRTIGERLNEVCRVSNTELWMENDVLRFKPRRSP